MRAVRSITGAPTLVEVDEPSGGDWPVLQVGSVDVADPARHNDKGNVAVAQHPVCQVDVAVACVANSRFAHGNHSGITEVSGMSDPRRKPCACVSRMTPGPSPRASGTPRCSSPPARALETQKARPAGRRPPIGRSEPSTSTVRCAAWSAGRGVD